ncbi:MAG: HAMP domain-containing histidine kinase [Alistipes sp.]|jgi:signal transduction histidine kinase|nr:HAMP domain-containing histidine kinase [Alistipes sp.]
MKERLQTILRAAASRQGAIIAVWVLFMAVSFGVLGELASRLRQREKDYVELWAWSMRRMGDVRFGEIMDMVTGEGDPIPFILVSDSGTVESSHLVSARTIEDPERLQRKLSRLARDNDYVTVTLRNGTRYLMFYGRSRTLSFLTFFPLVQLLAFALLLWLWVVTFRSGKQSEQNRVWVGLAKETAHQLGTPTSSLLGWVEYLKTQPVDQETVAEMGKDLTHLMKIADRFSKIGSDTPLEPANVNELVGDAVIYFRKRIPRNVELDYNGLAMAPVRSRINAALFEWVIENLLKNALDALQGHGKIDVNISRDDKNLFIDVTDTGRGIPRANREKIFEPGFSTKTRGWGLGLSLSRRVIEEYHKGRIFVADSEPGRGTTMRVVLKLIP